jgi:hypothetical protein
MIQKTTLIKLSKFNMPVLRRRAKKMVRKKFKKTIKLSDLDKIWKEYVEYGIVAPLLRSGKVEVGSSMEIEIVGKKILDNKKLTAMLIGGRNMNRNGMVKEAVMFDRNRPGITYSVNLTDKNYKPGLLIFKTDPKLAKKVHNELKNTNTYYRIQ